MRELSRKLWWVVLVGVLSGCGGAADFVTKPASSIAQKQSNLFYIILGIAAVIFVIVEGGLIYAIVRYRRRKGDQGEPRQFDNHLGLEITWTVIPVLIVIFLFYLTVTTVNGIALPSSSPNDVNINVIGHRWWWEFTYSDLKITTAGELVIPINTTIRINLTSADVVHSFWVPQLAGKTDAIPGQPNAMWITANQTGTYDGQCAEFCGIDHAQMRLKVVALSKADFDAWVANQQLPAPAPVTDLEIKGQQLVASGVCAACHTIDGTKANGRVGPNLSHLYSRSTFGGASFPLTDQDLSAWLTNPQAVKPGNLMKIAVAGQDLPAVLAYLKTLK